MLNFSKKITKTANNNPAQQQQQQVQPRRVLSNLANNTNLNDDACRVPNSTVNSLASTVGSATASIHNNNNNTNNSNSGSATVPINNTSNISRQINFFLFF